MIWRENEFERQVCSNFSDTEGQVSNAPAIQFLAIPMGFRTITVSGCLFWVWLINFVKMIFQFSHVNTGKNISGSATLYGEVIGISALAFILCHERTNYYMALLLSTCSQLANLVSLHVHNFF